MKSANLPQHHRSTDISLLLLVGALSLFGLLMVYDSSLMLALRDFGDKYYYVREQIQWMILGWIGCLVLSRIPYRLYKSIALPILVVIMVMLVSVFIPGIGVKALGAHRWIHIGPIVLQPAEFAKLATVIYLSAWLSKKERGRLLAFVLLLGMLGGLILLEPDMGTAMILSASAVFLYFVSGAPTRHFLYIVPVAAVLIVVMAVASPYRFARLTSFMNPEKDPLGSSYQIRQSIIALGSGGLFGVGLGKSRQKYEYLPEANTDAIFSIVGEETGFVGTVLLIGLYMLIVWKGLSVATHAPDPFGRMLAAGVTGWIGVQACINMAAAAALIPLTGVPLPLISSGGSSVVTILAGVGIIVNVSRLSDPDHKIR
jgi:cell division protein FtsW